MTLKALGKNIKTVRTEILNITQEELAEAVNSSQIIVSRLERGQGASIYLLLKVIEYFKSRGLNAASIFDEPFNKESLFNEGGGHESEKNILVSQLINLIREIDKEGATETDKLQVQFLLSKLFTGNS